MIGSEFINKYVIIRANRAGVFAGILEEMKDSEVILKDCRRIWYWDGASSISQLAEEGTSKPDNCKFPISVRKILIRDVIEIIPASKKSEKSILGVKIWKS